MNKKILPGIKIYHFEKPTVLHDSDILYVGEELSCKEKDMQNEDQNVDVNNIYTILSLFLTERSIQS